MCSDVSHGYMHNSVCQMELDRVVGHDRIPTPEDFPHLPYIQAVIKECHRWRPVLPLVVPHATIEDVNVRLTHGSSTFLTYTFKQYHGFRIPAGTTIFINTWGMSHDPKTHERPEDFWPDRWMLQKSDTERGIDDTDVRNHTWFGSGRRFCTGIHLANNSLVGNLWRVVDGD
jgi:cytochrome P450